MMQEYGEKLKEKAMEIVEVVQRVEQVNTY
jgi:hypothetical protein